MPQPKQHWFRSRWVVFVCAAVCFLVTVSFAKELLRSYRINQEIEELHAAIDDLQHHNQKTSSFVEYLKTDAYFQEQARLKLGLKEQGEKVVVLTPSDAPPNATAPRSPLFNDVLSDNQRPGGNPNHWLVYFFGTK
jgi:cell division protein FtsB